MRLFSNFIIVLVALVFTLVGCEKPVNTSLHGNIRNIVTGVGVAGAKVTVTVEPAIDSKLIYEFVTNSDGTYVLDLNLKPSITYKLRYFFDKNNCQTDLKNNYTSGINTKTTKSIDWEIAPLGYLTVNINNINCFDNHDELYIRWYYDPIPVTQGMVLPYPGCSHMNGTQHKSPMGWHYVVGHVKKNAIQTPFTDSVYVSEGDTAVWNIDY
jgi:hypothetical protein